jgi:hypothetical protein
VNRLRCSFQAKPKSSCPLLEGLVLGEAGTVDDVVFSRRPPEGALAADDEAAEIEIQTGSRAPTDVGLVVAFRMERAQANIALGAEAAKCLSVRHGGAKPKHQNKRGNSAGVQSPHYNPFLTVYVRNLWTETRTPIGGHSNSLRNPKAH